MAISANNSLQFGVSAGSSLKYAARVLATDVSSSRYTFSRPMTLVVSPARQLENSSILNIAPPRPPSKNLLHVSKPKPPPKPNRLGPAAEGQAKIVVVAKESDRTLVELERLPEGSSAVLFRGTSIEEFSTPEGKQALAEANVLLNCVGKESDWPLQKGRHRSLCYRSLPAGAGRLTQEIRNSAIPLNVLREINTQQDTLWRRMYG